MKDTKGIPITDEERKRRLAQSQAAKAKNPPRAARKPPRKQAQKVRTPVIWSAGASQKVPRLAPGGTLTGRDSEETVKSHLLLDKGVVLPRLIPTYVQPHLFRVKKNLRSFFPFIPDDQPLPTKIALICRPDVERFLSVGYVESDSTAPIDWTATHTTEVDYIWSAQLNVNLCFDENLHLTNRSSKVVATTVPKAGFRYFKSDKVADGAKVFPGILHASDKVFLAVNVTNPDQRDMDVIPFLTVFSGDPSNPTSTTIDFDQQVAGHQTTTQINYFLNAANISAGDWNGYFNAATTFGFAIGIRIANAADMGRIPSGLKLQMFESENANLVHAAGVRWTDRNLFELLDDAGTLRNQYNKSDSFSVTGATLWLENVTAQIYKGGSITAAQLPGGSEANLPSIATQMESFIRRQTSRQLDSNSLAKGMFWTYIPEKVQDVLFEPTGQEQLPIRQVLQKPYMAAVLGLPISSEASPEFVIDLRMMLEYITQEIDAPKVLAPSNINNWLEKYYGELAKHCCITENPKHFEHFKQVAKSVVTSPVFKQAAKDLIMYGIKTLPLIATSVF